MNSLFNLDNPIMVVLDRIVDVVILNLLFILCCIPILTIGSSVSALYYCMLKIERKRDSSIVKMFFSSFRANFKQGVVMTLLFIAVILFLMTDIQICNILELSILKFVRVVIYILIFVVFVILCYAFPLLAQFENTIQNILKNALLMAFGNPGYTVIVMLLNSIPILLFFLLPEMFLFSFVIWLTFGFALIALMNSKMFVRIFDKFIPANQEL